MRVFDSLEQISPETFPRGTAVAIGKFDGVHLGHRALLARVALVAEQQSLDPVVFTFANNPLSLLRPEVCPDPIMSMQQRLDALDAEGVTACVMVPFDDALAGIEAGDFVTEVLVGKLRAKHLCVGSDFRFGHRGAGGPELLKRLGSELGFTVEIIDDVDDDELGRVSSSRVREAIVRGDVATAGRMLGRPVTVRGEVVHGDARGRELGFPTANLDPNHLEGLQPADGVYAGWAIVDGARYEAAISVGANITFEPEGRPRVEAFLIGFSGDLYGRVTEVQFVQRLRGMAAFSSIDTLIARMHEDVSETRELLAGHRGRRRDATEGEERSSGLLLSAPRQAEVGWTRIAPVRDAQAVVTFTFQAEHFRPESACRSWRVSAIPQPVSRASTTPIRRFMAFTTATRKSSSRNHGRKRHTHNEGIIPLLARAVREVEASAHRGKASPSGRTKFQVIALLMREERARVKTEEGISDAERAETLKRLDGVAAILAKTAARDTSLITLLEPTAPISEATRLLKRKMLQQAGIEVPEDEPVVETRTTVVPAELAERQVEPPGIEARMLANPFLAPDLARVKRPTPVVRLANWELLGPLLKSFEQGGGGSACMALPEAPVIDRLAPRGLELMPHQARFLESVREGHRGFLLADEPGLGKTAQSVLAASVANAYPLLVVVPNVVKMNWAREVERWTPQRRVTVIHGDGDEIDAFADVFVVNYDILDRHLSWMLGFGFKGMVVDEAHMIKNVHSQRSRNVLAIAQSIRDRVPGGRPLLLALTGTPLINDVDDFRAIWRFLGWADAEKPGPELLAALESNGYTPADSAFYPAARQSVIDLGIVRRRKLDVAADLPAKRVVDLPVELDDDLGRGIREAEKQLSDKLLLRFNSLKAGRLGKGMSDGALVRMVCAQELEDSNASASGINVFTMVRQIGQAKAGMAADYAAQLAHSVGKVVFFAKHIDVMDRAEAALADRGLRTVSIRGDQSATQRQEQIDAFNNDPTVSVAVCSLTAAGVGVNLQAASDVVLAELSWTDAEQTQAIDRVHRIGQEEPVTAWRIVAAQTIDARIAELIDSKAGLAARALDGATAPAEDADSVQLLALMSVLNSAIAGC